MLKGANGDADCEAISAVTVAMAVPREKVSTAKGYRVIAYWRSNSSAARTMGTGE